MPDSDRYKLEFRKLPGDLPNAFAIPGGTIIVSDGLVAALPDEDAFHCRRRARDRPSGTPPRVATRTTRVRGDRRCNAADRRRQLGDRCGAGGADVSAEQPLLARLRTRGGCLCVRGTARSRHHSGVVRQRAAQAGSALAGIDRRRQRIGLHLHTPRLSGTHRCSARSRARIRTARSDRREADGGERKRGR